MTIRILVAGRRGELSLAWWADRLAEALDAAGRPARVVWEDGADAVRDGTAADGEGNAGTVAAQRAVGGESEREQKPVDEIIARLSNDGKLCNAAGSSGIGGKPREEGFTLILRGDGRVEVAGHDITGLCYGLGEITRHIADGGKPETLRGGTVAPRYAFRAIKFNLPWSCYRSNVSVTLHTETVRDLAFWDGFLDMIAEHRFNVLTLWNVHPYPYMTRSKSYPLACGLTDAELAEWRGFWTGLFARCRQRCIRPFVMSMNVLVSAGFREHYDANAYDDSVHWGPAHITPDIENYLRESVTQIIDEYPDLAGVGTSLGEHMNGITPEEREAFRDRVYNEAVRRASRPVEIIWRAPFSANTDAKVTRGAIENAGLPPSGHPIWMEIKYNFSHGYSSPKLLAAHGVTRQSAGGADGVRGLLKDYWEPEPEQYKMALMVRNEDFFALRWAEPDYVRAHIAENDKSYVGGYFIGSEGFIPAKEYTHCPDHPHVNWRYAYEKNRLYYMIWGRLLFDPTTPDSVFERDIERRHGVEREGYSEWITPGSMTVGKSLLKAYRNACGMPMALATFHSATWDFSLYSEGFISTKFNAHMFTDWRFNGYEPGRSFITLEHLINCQPLDPNWLSAREYAERMVFGTGGAGGVAGGASSPEEMRRELKEGGNAWRLEALLKPWEPGSSEEKVTPLDVARRLDEGAGEAQAALGALIGSLITWTPEMAKIQTLQCEMDDVCAWIELSHYLACKLRAAAAMAIYLVNHDPAMRAEAVRWLDEPNAKTHWVKLVEITERHYREMPLVCLGTQPFSWRLFLPEVDADIRYASGHH